ncbi:hypothetical protein [Rhizobium leguminosarum]|uniref:hypothetical protein n=1 Tax=Rhizobium leguminosarum TaxID=384 RepID=UPI00144103BA|nr:hypothetical protein [Rhizobium leguminosarum]MBY5867123.1 hypothetical protein [Rhizobium leguminosarum]NKM02889.1 hypothetical protein [Rhizobium leguminosarum bv. viciae]
MKALAIFLLLLTCVTAKAQTWEECGGSQGSSICIDLRDERSLRGGLFIAPERSVTEKNIVLNFAVQEAEPTGSEYARVGVFNKKFSVVTSLTPQSQVPQRVIGFSPSPSSEQFDFFNFQSKDYGLLFNVDGLERRFVYQFPKTTLKSNIPIKLEEPRFLAVILPLKSEGLEIRSGNTEFPDRLSDKDSARVYAGNAVDAKTNAVEIRYRVQANDFQKTVSQYALKFIVLFFSPAVGLMFIRPVNTQQRSRLKWMIGTMILLETVILIAYGYISYFLLKSFDTNAILDSALALFAICFTSYAAWETAKAKPEAP